MKRHTTSNEPGFLIGSSDAMQAVRDELRTIAEYPFSVRIEGPRGTGKNMAARWLHHASGRHGKFERCGLNMVSASDGRELGELVGWMRGAFTGATHNHPGAIERAHGGTVFLNEFGTASPRVQEILLHLLEEETVQRLGEAVERPVDVRMVFATNLDMTRAVADGRIRADLYDRLGNLIVTMPPLIERIGDIPELAAAIIVKLAQKAKMEPPTLRPADLDRLMAYDWPGNVRELENVLTWYIVHQRLPGLIPGSPLPSSGWRSVAHRALAQHRGRKAAAARALGVSRQTLHEFLKNSRALPPTLSASYISAASPVPIPARK